MDLTRINDAIAALKFLSDYATIEAERCDSTLLSYAVTVAGQKVYDVLLRYSELIDYLSTLGSSLAQDCSDSMCSIGIQSDSKIAVIHQIFDVLE